jgi:hypothetical protein
LHCGSANCVKRIAAFRDRLSSLLPVSRSSLHSKGRSGSNCEAASNRGITNGTFAAGVVKLPRDACPLRQPRSLGCRDSYGGT